MRTLKVVSLFLLAAFVTACASTLRLPGQRDPMVEVVRILADALKDQKAPPTPTPTPTPSPTPKAYTIKFGTSFRLVPEPTPEAH